MIGVDLFMSPESSPVVSGEIALWRAVIAQAMLDAEKYLTTTRNQASPGILESDQARNWLTGYSRDFHLVCIYAGIDPSYLKKRVKEVLG